jgi:hypothetical protein
MKIMSKFKKIKELSGVVGFNFRNGGIIYFLKKSISFVSLMAYSNTKAYVFEMEVSDKKFNFLPKINDVTLKVLTRVDQYDDLLQEGFDLYSLIDREWITEGTIPFCVFVGRELAHVTWVASNAKAKKNIESSPFPINYGQFEVVSGGSKTSPKYLRKGLYLYVYSEMLKTLRRWGKKKIKFTISENNIASRRALEKFEPKIIGEIKILILLGCARFKTFVY